MSWAIIRKIFILAALLGLLVPAAPGLAEDRPLLMEGKKTIFQRVITHPEAALHQAPGGAAVAKIIPFSVLYVYERRTHDGAVWLRVAPDTVGGGQGWLPAAAASDWKQALVLLFAERVSREPLLFFKESGDLEDLAGQKDIGGALARLRSEFQKYAAEKTAPPAAFPVLAMEPGDEVGAVPYDHFYLMPIFSYQELFEGVKFLEVGSIDPALGGDESGAGGGDDGGRGGPAAGSAKNAIAFVMDATISMGPYIEKSREITREIYDEVEARGQGDNVALGIVAFRNSVEASPRLGYVSKVISPLRLAMERDEFEKALSEVREAEVSTHSYNEDSLAGIKTAIEELDWDPYNGRVVLLITDAGPLEITDPYISTMMTTGEIADLARQKNIKIITLHVKSGSGLKNHGYAEEAYRLLSFNAEDYSGYLSWDAPTAEKGAADFEGTVQSLTAGMTRTLFGKRDEPKKKKPAASDLEERAAALGEALGYSIRLEYLGRANRSVAPRVVRSWIADKDMARLAAANDRAVVPTVEVAVLLSKDQLSALSRQLKMIIDNAERVKKTGATDFFAAILSASTQISRDPARFAANPETNLGEMGVLGEFLDGLPYQSDIMGMTERDWYGMSIGQQTQFINRLKSRLARYEEYDRDVDNWARFGGAHPGDWLYRVPLTMLP
ncbi:MAG: VWA domain-containing protein [Candidatus Adiutrix sp.]|jgi:serine/threonine-protein kinase PpkA|nr:VWA domain-containing protein [Candidatus Adiutrix sp.]